MHPFGLLLFVLFFCIQVRSSPRNSLAGSSRENDLKQLQRAGTKSGDSSGEVQPPGSHEFRAEHFAYLLFGLLESRQPLLQCFCIVGPQVLDIQDGQIPRFKHLHDFTQCGCVGARKNAFSGPRAEGTRMIAPYKVEKSAPGFGKRAVDDTPQLSVVFPSNVFQHSYGDKRITLAGNVPVIVFDEYHSLA
jgi:hypothetical protein